MERSITPWRILRSSQHISFKYNLKSIVGLPYTIVRLLTEYFHVLNPGDVVEIVDQDDLFVWLRGEVVSVTKVTIKNISKRSLVNGMPCAHVRKYFNPGKRAMRFVVNTLRQTYDRQDIDCGTIVSVTELQVLEVNYPAWREGIVEDPPCPPLTSSGDLAL